ncbi:hypothetical protein CONPUDRAFT_78122 [Coniophora puteana RWD-64-598 SS2]|uniref:Uncharacterized protein n=1 Tax=Coniophora puteana (strain RWD-64-598) TaxID=741705 RepID=R7SE83_CONPW|nr:uncharacterized protein CONPUDRAFT_78122 [Coniophora puteana RWD-64-598 SS2]EIW74483.1 hypothetical protein CONPUDRAFT_78122 [Coniophora puteana RWD-64-598 SS2]
MGRPKLYFTEEDRKEARKRWNATHYARTEDAKLLVELVEFRRQKKSDKRTTKSYQRSGPVEVKHDLESDYLLCNRDKIDLGERLFECELEESLLEQALLEKLQQIEDSKQPEEKQAFYRHLLSPSPIPRRSSSTPQASNRFTGASLMAHHPSEAFSSPIWPSSASSSPSNHGDEWQPMVQEPSSICAIPGLELEANGAPSGTSILPPVPNVQDSGEINGWIGRLCEDFIHARSDAQRKNLLDKINAVYEGIGDVMDDAVRVRGYRNPWSQPAKDVRWIVDVNLAVQEVLMTMVFEDAPALALLNTTKSEDKLMTMESYMQVIDFNNANFVAPTQKKRGRKSKSGTPPNDNNVAPTPTTDSVTATADSVETTDLDIATAPAKRKKRWTTPEQLRWLTDRIPSYVEAVTAETTEDFWPELYGDWFIDFPEKPQSLKNLNPATMSKQERLVHRRAIDKRKDQLYSWFRWHTRDDITSSRAIHRASTLLDAIIVPRTRAHSDTEIFTRLYYDDIERELADDPDYPGSAHPLHLQFVRKHAKALLEKEKDNEAIMGAIQGHKDAEADIKAKLDAGEGLAESPEVLATIARNLPDSFRELMALSSEKVTSGHCDGVFYSMIMGCRDPVTGRMTVTSVHLGNGPNGKNFEKDSTHWSKVKKEFNEWVQTATPPKPISNQQKQPTGGNEILCTKSGGKKREHESKEGQSDDEQSSSALYTITEHPTGPEDANMARTGDFSLATPAASLPNPGTTSITTTGGDELVFTQCEPQLIDQSAEQVYTTDLTADFTCQDLSTLFVASQESSRQHPPTSYGASDISTHQQGPPTSFIASDASAHQYPPASLITSDASAHQYSPASLIASDASVHQYPPGSFVASDTSMYHYPATSFNPYNINMHQCQPTSAVAYGSSVPDTTAELDWSWLDDSSFSSLLADTGLAHGNDLSNYSELPPNTPLSLQPSFTPPAASPLVWQQESVQQAVLPAVILSDVAHPSSSSLSALPSPPQSSPGPAASPSLHVPESTCGSLSVHGAGAVVEAPMEHSEGAEPNLYRRSRRPLMPSKQNEINNRIGDATTSTKAKRGAENIEQGSTKK